MHVPITFAALACLTALLFVLRLRWTHLAPSIKRVILVTAVSSIALFGCTTLLGLSTASLTVNSSLGWFAVAGYELLLLLFTRIRPRWLTGLTAAVLLTPLLAASVLLPLAALFDRDPAVNVFIGQNIVLSKVPWEAAGSGNGGTDITLSRIPHALPFLRRRIATLRLYNTQCDTVAATATPNMSNHTIDIYCPASVQSESPHNVVIRAK